MMMGLLGGEGGKDLGNIFAFQSLWIGREYNEDGTLKEEGEEIKQDTPIDIEGGDTVTIRYTWNIKERDAQPGDTASTKIPDIFDIAGNFPESPILLSDGTRVGTWTISGRYLEFTFDEGLEGIDTDNLEDTFIEFGFNLKMDEFEENVTQVIKFEGVEVKVFNITIKPISMEAESVNKIGVPDGGINTKEGYKDAKEITWTIDVLNTEETDLEGAVISEDNIPEGLELVADSFRITELTIGYNGGVFEKGSSTDISATSNGAGGFEIPLPKMKPYSGYRIEYTTEIIDFSKTNFTNTAKLIKDGTELEASATVGNLIRSAPLEK